MKVFEESHLRFEFGDDWTLIEQYDEHADFDEIKDAVIGTKGVDFVGILQDKMLYFFEVKNFRGHRISSKGRFKEDDDPVWLEVAQKVRDTIAGIIGGNRMSLDVEDKLKWQQMANFLTDPKRRVFIVLWLEQDDDNQQKVYKRKKNKNYKTDLKGKLKDSLKWLTKDVLVLDCNYNPLEEYLTVTFLPRPPIP